MTCLFTSEILEYLILSIKHDIVKINIFLIQND